MREGNYLCKHVRFNDEEDRYEYKFTQVNQFFSFAYANLLFVHRLFGFDVIRGLWIGKILLIFIRANTYRSRYYRIICTQKLRTVCCWFIFNILHISHLSFSHFMITKSIDRQCLGRTRKLSYNWILLIHNVNTEHKRQNEKEKGNTQNRNLNEIICFPCSSSNRIANEFFSLNYSSVWFRRYTLCKCWLARSDPNIRIRYNWMELSIIKPHWTTHSLVYSCSAHFPNWINYEANGRVSRFC